MSSETLSDDEVAELQARPSTELGGYRRVLLRPRERDALCATVRALRTERDKLRKEAREAAFKDAGYVVRQCSLRSEKYPNRYITAAAFKTRVECAIEAAANTQEGGGDG